MDPDTYLMMLMEHLQKPETWLIEHAPEAAGNPPHLDVELLSKIADYVVIEEEMFGDFDRLRAAERDQRIKDTLMIGLFIYGFQQYKYNGDHDYFVEET